MLSIAMRKNMENKKQYQLGDIIEMKKAHPCNFRSKQFEIIRMGADIKIRCLGCGNIIMMTRRQFEERMKKNLSIKTEK